MIKNSILKFSTLLLLTGVLVLSGCGGGGGGGGGNTAPIGDITGTWTVSEVSDETSLGDGIVNSTYSLDATSQ